MDGDPRSLLRRRHNIRSLITGEILVGTSDAFGQDPNGLIEETLVVAGTIKLAPQQTKHLWKHELLNFHIFNNLEHACVNPHGRGAMPARCPWAPAHRVPRLGLRGMIGNPGRWGAAGAVGEEGLLVQRDTVTVSSSSDLYLDSSHSGPHRSQTREHTCIRRE